jgi:hypothetical protein
LARAGHGGHLERKAQSRSFPEKSLNDDPRPSPAAQAVWGPVYYVRHRPLALRG